MLAAARRPSWPKRSGPKSKAEAPARAAASIIINANSTWRFSPSTALSFSLERAVKPSGWLRSRAGAGPKGLEQAARLKGAAGGK